jgi:hypothetical protein
MPIRLKRRFFTRGSRRSFLKRRRRRLRAVRRRPLIEKIEFDEGKVNWLKEGF